MFKERFKYYKSKVPVPDFKDVIDLDAPRPNGEVEAVALNIDDNLVGCSVPDGIQPVHNWRCYSLPSHPGILVIRNPFTTQGQRYWIARCLRDYPRDPNLVNLNSHLFTAAVIADWWHELGNCKDKDEARRMKLGMRWATLGYHHDWDTKVYNEKMRNDFPSDLGKMCKFFADILGFELFEAQAAIVNYYPIGTTLAGHTDHSEVNLNAPLFSFSFGQTAIFLIGGRTKEEKPNAIFLNSGDVLVMSGESRLCYHAVPRIFRAHKDNWTWPWNEIVPNRTAEHMEPNHKKSRIAYESNANDWHLDTALYQQVADEIFWSPFRDYLNESRININVRQVLNEGDIGLFSQSVISL